ncbi:DUF2244 domain-containing protein [Paracoccus sp. 1_MG-2023]|uniref:DUF2244 domain-containing protein n=1 Tax=unclassified Paracoccus (in: a-proteobacteria) TaxID=2688777 RepID=UPI001C09616C|nr:MULTISPECIES: DUF2244 domain-containing protein [unclassified Paracoccus (in: a-proteobacteria)]MBU2958180.1 DUF2244 domain-containing protein [Paracoccus sp. C2R09]MDO6668307.1 DUF2244 domain-containing protein [Paracoccus sp. 1_MG-2023]
MPYRWTETAPEQSGAVCHELTLWPHRSLPRRGFVWFIGATVTMVALPLIAVIGTTALWPLLIFVALAVAGVWFALHLTYRSGQTHERLRFDGRRLDLVRADPGRPDREWRTNSFWVRATLRPGPVESYLVLTDGRRELELGAFLTPEERRALSDDIARRLASLR